MSGINNNIQQQGNTLQGADPQPDLTSIHTTKQVQFDILFDILHEIYERDRWTNDRLQQMEIGIGDLYVFEAGKRYEDDPVNNIQVADLIFHNGQQHP